MLVARAALVRTHPDGSIKPYCQNKHTCDDIDVEILHDLFISICK